MIDNRENNLSEVLDMNPELSALEARLASLTIRSNKVSLEKIRQKGLLELCRSAQESVTKPLIGEKLAATIVKSGEQEITLSLRHYIRSVRFSAVLIGLLIGLVLGGIAILILIQNLTPSQPSREPVETPSIFIKPVPSAPLSPLNFSL
ncbi:MAG: hypothetical protein Q4C95_09465 [Planctomycetia bacterium]|nr:hypothetical protein [Planctomycetia bacterium]